MKSILQAVLKFRHTAFLDIITVCKKLFLCTMQTPSGREVGMLIFKKLTIKQTELFGRSAVTVSGNTRL
jgi:hypothetical protein